MKNFGMMQTSQTTRLNTAAAAFLALVAGSSWTLANGYAVHEPATVFYGKVIGTGSAQAFLATEGGGYITGQNIRVDGGITRSV